MFFKEISKKTKNLLNYIKSVDSDPFELDIKNNLIRKFVFFLFMFLCAILSFYLYKLETLNYVGLIAAWLIILAICLYYFFQPVNINRIIIRLLYAGIALLALVGIYASVKDMNQMEGELATSIIQRASPELLKYQYSIVLLAYIFFEFLLRLLSKSSLKIRKEIENNVFAVRLYFILTLIFINIVIEIVRKTG